MQRGAEQKQLASVRAPEQRGTSVIALDSFEPDVTGGLRPLRDIIEDLYLFLFVYC